MPQDGLRSAVYRSFVTCDDLKGVVECGKIRKSKNSPKRLEGKVVESRRMPKNLNSSSAYNKEGKEMASKNVKENLHNPSSFQLVEVSRGAQKLNQVIDSWSKGMTFGGNSKEIAKDLLKGALDLQESLVMLGKLQEASHYMAKLKKKQKEKSSAERIDEVCIERTNSDPFPDRPSQMGLQKPRLSVDGAASRDCYEKLRIAIRDGLARQNLLPPSCAEKKIYCDKRSLNSGVDIASPSSSHSSMVSSHNFTHSDSSLPSRGPQKLKGSNLIAKLMGLEEIPLPAVQTNLKKQMENEKISSPRRPVFDDLPMARKPQAAAYGHKVGTEQRELKEIVETMQFKGLLKRNSAERFGLHYHHINASKTKKRLTEDAPPIVILKPVCFSCVKEDEPHLKKFIRDSGDVNTDEVLGKLKMKELQSQTTDLNEGVLNSNETCRRVKGEETPTKRHSQKGTKCSKGVQAKPEEIVVKTNDKPSSIKLKARGPVNQQQKKKTIDKKVDRIQKLTATENKPAQVESKQAEVENGKLKAVSMSLDQAKVAPAKERKSETRRSIIKKPQQKSASSTFNSNLKTPVISGKCGDQKKNPDNEKPIEESLAANLEVENEGHNWCNKLVDLNCESESNMTSISTITTDQLLIKEGMDATEIQIEDQCDISQGFPCHVTPQTTQDENHVKSAEEANHCISNSITEWKCFRTRTVEEDLFLGSPSFLSYAEELFDVNANQALVLQTSSLDDSEMAESRLLLDCANELMRHKSIGYGRTINPFLLVSVKSLKTSLSLAQLVGEVCNGIENLRSCGKHSGEMLSTESLNSVLERDLRFDVVGSGAWDLGWRHNFTVDELDQVVGDIVKLVFSGLIEEMFADFVL